MFNHKHYIPILKAKAGERWALRHLTPQIRSHLTPLIEIHAHKNKPSVDHIGEILNDLVASWGTEQPFFLDTVWLDHPSVDAQLLLHAFQHARDLGLRAIPVMRINYDPACLDTISTIHGADQRGCMVRLAQSEFGAQPALEGVLEYTKLPLDQVDLLLDYRSHAMQLARDVTRVWNVLAWRTLTTAASAFPASTSNLPKYTWSRVPRHDWLSWELPLTTVALPRKPSFSDYTTRDPGAPAAGGLPSVNLRYTKQKDWLVRVDGLLKAGEASDMYDVCESLIAIGEFDGPAYSQGDYMIHQTAQRAVGPGGPQSWVQWSVSHHMTFVVNQLQNHGAL